MNYEKGYFETFAQKLCDFAMRRYVIPYLREHGVIQSYRATIMAKDTQNQTMTIQRPFDNPVQIPYSDGVSSLSVGDSCVVFVFGESSNSVVAADGKMSTLTGESLARFG